MVDPAAVTAGMLAILDRAGAAYRVYEHRPILSYADAEAVRQETGWTGTEGKVVVCRAADGFAVYVTRQGERLDQRALKRAFGLRKVRLATPEELWERFGAQPGAAYPFGFAPEVPILVDPALYAEDWLLFSAALPTITLQIRGADLRAVFTGLPNPTREADRAVSPSGASHEGRSDG